MPSGKFASTIGLGLVGFIGLAVTFGLCHGFNPCNVVFFPDVGGSISPTECEEILTSAAKKATEKFPKSAELFFVLTLATRIEAALLGSLGAAALFAITLPLRERKTINLACALFGTFAFLIDGNHAGLIPFGRNGMVPLSARGPSIGLTAIQFLVATFNWYGFVGSLSAGSNLKKD